MSERPEGAEIVGIRRKKGKKGRYYCRSNLTDLWMATVLDWTGHRLLGPAGSTMATVHCHQRLFGRPEHTLE